MIKIYAAVTIVMSVIAFAVYGIDKRRARFGKWRIPESTLFLLAFCGGAFGALAGMKFFRHKTKKPSFVFGVPFAMALWVILGIFIYTRFI